MYHTKYIIKTTLCLPFLLFSVSTFPMFTNFFEKVKQATLERIERNEKRKEKDAKEAKQRNKERIARRQRKKEYAQQLKDIQNIKTVVEVDAAIDNITARQYENILTELQRITYRSYDDLEKEINEQRRITKKLLKKENPHADHDPNIPNSITEQLCEALSHYHINPNNINFAYKNSDDAAATAYSGNMFAKSSIYKSKMINKPRITIYNLLLKQPHDDQRSVYHHEISHILLQHTYIRDLAWNKLPNILEETTTEPYTASEIWYKKKGISPLSSLIEEEADIHASLSSTPIAYTQMQQRCSYWPHTHIIDAQKHCEQLTVIYNLMKHKDELSQEKSL